MSTNHHHGHHKHVLPIVGVSEHSFDEAVRKGIETFRACKIVEDYQKFDFYAFEVVKLYGGIKDTGKIKDGKRIIDGLTYKAEINVIAEHDH